jgi:hypothetical protein
MKLIRSALAVVAAACLPLGAAAQHAMQIIPLKYRTVEQVLPTLRPLLEPGAVLSGQNNQLIVRTSPGNLEELRRVLDSIDRPARRLQISVRFDDVAAASSEGLDASGRISNRSTRIDIGAHDSRSGTRERVDQRVQVIEGGRAFIATGQSRTVPQRQIIQTPGGVVAQETFVVQDLSTGFEVVPRLAGSTVFLDIAPQRETPGAIAGSVQSQRVASSISARLGDWIEVGGLAASGAREERGLGSASRASATESRRVFVKVEEIGN